MSKNDQTEDDDLENDSFDDKDEALDVEEDMVEEKESTPEVQVKINKEARKKLEELLEQKRLKKMIEDDFYGSEYD